jgi:hypothetical protein
MKNFTISLCIVAALLVLGLVFYAGRKSVTPEIRERVEWKHDTTTVAGKTVYVPPEAPDPDRNEVAEWCRSYEEEIASERAQKREAFSAWLPLASDSALGFCPVDIEADQACAELFFAELDKRELARPVIQPKPPVEHPATPIKYKRAGFCFVPGISAGLESDVKGWAPAPVGYFDIEWAWWGRANVALGLNTKSVKPLHLRYRLPLFTNNLILGAWVALPYNDIKQPAVGAGASVGF